MNDNDTGQFGQDDDLKLPRGAFLAFRQSGGLRFSLRETIVYHDGRVLTRRQGKLGAGQGSRQITPAELDQLKELIQQSGFFGLPHSIGRQSPDGYAYELIVRLDRRSRSIEFFDGHIPAALQPLLRQLKTLTVSHDVQES